MKAHFNRFRRSRSTTAQFLRFATVGIKISLIDIGLVYLLPWLLGLNIYQARVISLSTALFAGYLLNRYFTFGGFQKGHFLGQMAGHFGVHLIGGALNFGVFSAFLTLGKRYFENPVILAALPLVCLVLGGIAGMTFNFLLSKKLVFQTGKQKGSAEESSVFANGKSELQQTG